MFDHRTHTVPPYPPESPVGYTLFVTTVTLDPSNVITESDETNNATVLHFDTRDVIPVDVRPTTVMDVPCWPDWGKCHVCKSRHPMQR